MATKKSKSSSVPVTPAEISVEAEPVQAAAQPVPVKPKRVKKVKSASKRAATAKAAKAAKSTKQSKAGKPAKSAPATKAKAAEKASAKPKVKAAKPDGEKKSKSETAKLLDSTVVYEGKLFRVQHDHILEPGGIESYRDVIRHNGSVVILAIDPGKNKKDPWIVIERQYRHAANQFLWELPAGKLDEGEKAIEGAKRELEEETGYSAQKWSPLVEYYASPGFLGESMNVFLAEGLIAGDARPEHDEKIDFRLVKLTELLDLIDRGKIIDGKTLTTILLFARKLGIKTKK